MRQPITTAMEVIGMLMLSAAAGLTVGSWPLFCLLAGVVLFGAGLVEGRR